MIIELTFAPLSCILCTASTTPSLKGSFRPTIPGEKKEEEGGGEREERRKRNELQRRGERKIFTAK